MVDGLASLLVVLVPVAMVALVLGAVVHAIRVEGRHRAREVALLRDGARVEATVLRVYGLQGSVWCFDVRYATAQGAVEARVEQMMERHVAAGLHPGRAALARVDPRAPGVAVFDLEAMGYARR